MTRDGEIVTQSGYSSTVLGESTSGNGSEGTTVVGGSTTLTTAAGCKDGIPIGVDLEWIHIHDASSSMKDMHSETISALKSVVDIVNERLLSENTSDRLSFALVEAHDKSVACSLFDSDCSCTDVSAHRVSLSEMSCSLNSDCSGDRFFTEDMYIDISARPSLFDPLMTMSQTYSDSIESGSKMIRFVTMMTDECSRVSGRAASSPNLAKKYWKYINSRTYNKWASISSGIDKYTGAVTEYECDLRDYPTIDELSMNLSNSSMGVSVLFTGRENDQRADVEDYSKGEFWDLIVRASNESGAAFAYNSASGDSVDMAEKLLSGIQSILGDVCAGIEGTSAPSGSTVIGGSEGSSGSSTEIGGSEGSNGTGTTVAGGKTTVSGGSEGSSESSTVIGESDGSNGTGTTVVGGKTTVIGGSEGSNGSTTVIGSEGSNGTGTTVAGGNTTVIGGSEGSSGSSTDIGGSEGSNGTGTTVAGGNTTVIG